MRLALVTEVHAADNSVDLVLVEDGSRLAGVQVLGSLASSRTGLVDLPAPGLPASGDKWSLSEPRQQHDLIAAVDYVGRMPVVVGFLFPQVCQMLFDRLNFRLDRHASDVYSSVDNSGNIELFHPSGTHVRVAESPDHEDLTGHDVDGRFKVDRNTTRAPWLSVIVKNAGVEKARFRVDPSGNVTLSHAGDLSVATSGSATVTVGGATSVTSTGAATVTAPTIALDGATTVNGTLHVTGAATMDLGLSVTGSMSNNGTNIGSTHVHSDPQGGSTGTPV